jgi:hypothetical protein
MDLHRAITELRAELDLIDYAILSFERLASASPETRERPANRAPREEPKNQEKPARRERLLSARR